MVTISNFSSVLEIAFGINALAFIFELVPASDKRLVRKVNNYHKLVDEKVKLTKNTEAFPLALILSSTFTTYKLLLYAVCILFSLISLGILIYSGFYPDAQIKSGWMLLWLVVLFVPAPVCLIIIYWNASRWTDAAIELMENEIRKDRERA